MRHDSAAGNAGDWRYERMTHFHCEAPIHQRIRTEDEYDRTNKRRETMGVLHDRRD
jgi:hypothetical protein